MTVSSQRNLAPHVMFLLTLLISASACQRHTPVVIPSAFHWRNTDPLNRSDQEAIVVNGLQRIYFKLLDIDWNPSNGAYPVSSVRIPEVWINQEGQPGIWTDSVELVPCIYITNKTFVKINDSEVDQLASNLLRKLHREVPPTVHSVLLDCDWTATTENRFFRLVQRMHDSLDVPLVATIRLHQFANPDRTGVPPADRGMLMVYNVGKVDASTNTNSIFSMAEAEPYFREGKPYPLALDIALPTFSWGAHYRKGHFMGILQEIQITDATSLGLLRGAPTGFMQVTEENNDYLPELHLGDVIRMERMTPEVIDQAVELARRAVNSDTTAVAFFEVSTQTFQGLAPDFVDHVLREFGTRCLRKDAFPYPAY